MCGICGFITNKRVSLEQLKAMNDTMIHRGPNDSGEWISAFDEKNVIGFAQRRLSILDLSEKGHQPFFSKEKKCVVVFNGEIYNFLELKKELSEYTFLSNCDTEVIVAAYEKWGADFVKHFNGMFAIALFDKEKRILLLCRDRIGKKPLFYYLGNSELVFGSSLKPLLEYPYFTKELNAEVLPQFLYNRFITGKETIYKNVYRVRPGEIITFDGTSVKEDFFWSLIEDYYKCSSNQILSFEESKQNLKKELKESVRKRMIADVPIGAFLSGGYDSSLVTAVAQSISEQPIKTYSIGFQDPEFDEAPFAQTIANHLRTCHTNHYVTEKEMLELVASIPEFYDEPFADSSQIPSMLVAQIAKQDVTVALTGDGGDELFCGYSIYDKLAVAQKVEPIANVLRVILKESNPVFAKLPFSVRTILENRDDRYRTQFGRTFYQDIIRQITGNDIEVRYNEIAIDEPFWQKRRMLLDSITYLPDNNLCKVDRATMRYSLEARNPLLDVGVVEAAFRVPHAYKYHKGEKKYILKQLAYGYIPEELLNRPKKGFSVPIAQWLRGPLKDDLTEVISVGYLRNQGIFNAEFTNRFVNDFLETGDQGSFSGHNPSWIVWPLYMFQKWYQRYME